MIATAVASSPAGPVDSGLVLRCINDREGELRQPFSDPEKVYIPSSPAVYYGRVDALQMDTVIHRSVVNAKTQPRRQAGGQRGQIVQLTRPSQRRMVLTARNLPTMHGFLTLTYPKAYSNDGREVKRHLANMGKFLQRRGVSFFWWVEFQKRGAPHIHMVIDSPVDKADVSQAWYGIVGSGDPKHLKAGTRIERLRKPDAVARYVGKYIAKAEQKQVPEAYQNVGRLWGIVGRAQLKPKEPIAVDASPLTASAKTVRFVRRLVNARRRDERLQLLQDDKPVPRHLKPFKDKGRYGFIAWGTGQAVAAYLSKAMIPALQPEGRRPLIYA